MSLASLAGGGILPSSRRDRRHVVVIPVVPAIDYGAHGANERRAPVFPPTTLVDKSSFTPQTFLTRQSRFLASLLLVC